MTDVYQQSRGASRRGRRLMKIKLGLENKWEEYRRQRKDVLFQQMLKHVIIKT